MWFFEMLIVLFFILQILFSNIAELKTRDTRDSPMEVAYYCAISLGCLMHYYCEGFHLWCCVIWGTQVLLLMKDPKKEICWNIAMSG